MRNIGLPLIKLTGRITLGGYVKMAEQAVGVTGLSPADNHLHLYAKDSGGVSRLYYKDDADVEHALLSTGVGGVTGAGVAGRLAIWDSATNLTNDAELIWDTTNESLGIGGAPSTQASLHIRNDLTRGILFTHSDTGTTSSDGTYLGLAAGSGGAFYIFNQENNGVFLGTNNVTLLTLQADGSTLVNGFSAATKGLIVKAAASQSANLQEWQSSGGTGLSAVTAAGDIGIGTITPTLSQVLSHVLHIKAGNPGIRIESDSAGGWAFTEYVDDAGAIQFITGYRDTDNSYRINVGASLGGTPNFTMLSSGLVGISTASPAGKLGILGGPSRVGYNSALEIQPVSGSDFPSIVFGGQDTGHYSALIWTSSTSGTDDTTVGAYFLAVPTSSTNTDFRIYTNNQMGTGAPSERLRVLGNGNVDIGGTTGPFRLTVTAPNADGLAVRSNGGETSANVFLYPGSSSAANRAWGLSTYVAEVGDFAINQSNADEGNPATAGTSRLYIKPDGSVGIGNTAPDAKLHVSGSFKSESILLHQAAGGGATAHHITMSDGDVAHGMTTVFPTDVFYQVRAYGSSVGGAMVIGANDNGDRPGMLLQGIHGVTNPTDAQPAVLISGGKQDSGTSAEALGTAETILAIENGYADGGTKLWSVLGDGTLKALASTCFIDLSAISAGSKNLKITATSDTPTVAFTGGGNAPTTAPAGYLEIDVGGNPRYIPFWA